MIPGAHQPSSLSAFCLPGPVDPQLLSSSAIHPQNCRGCLPLHSSSSHFLSPRKPSSGRLRLNKNNINGFEGAKSWKRRSTARSAALAPIMGASSLVGTTRRFRWPLAIIPAGIVSTAIGQPWSLALIPAGLMLLGTLLPMFSTRSPSTEFIHAMQHFSAGMLLAAIFQELMPPMTAASTGPEICCMILGFSLGVALMIGLESVLSEDEDETTESGSMVRAPGGLIPVLSGMLKRLGMERPSFRTPIRMRGSNRVTALATAVRVAVASTLSTLLVQEFKKTPSEELSSYIQARFAELDENGDGMLEQKELGVALAAMGRRCSNAELAALIKTVDADEDGLLSLEEFETLVRLKIGVSGDGDEQVGLNDGRLKRSPPFPVTLALAVYVDSLVDGLLMGMALASNAGSGLFLVLALAVEMSILGYTFASSCLSQPRLVAAVVVLFGPIMLLMGAIMGSGIASLLAANSALFVGGIAFATSALLYMVCEELLIIAHESRERHVWWVDLQAYLGFMMSLVMEKMLRLTGVA